MRKTVSTLLSAILILFLVGLGAQNIPAHAQGGSSTDFSVSVEITGVIKSITVNALTLDDATAFTINNNTKGISPELKPGVTVTVGAEVDDGNLTALSINIGTTSNDSSPELAASATPSAEAPATATTAAPPGKGKGNGNGKGNDDGNDKGDDNGNGKGKGKGNGNGKGNDDGNGKGQGKGGQSLENCLKDTNQPIAIALAKAFNVTYTEIMTWHCKGNGFGEIARAYLLAQKGSLTVTQIFAMRDAHKGWGQIIKEAGLNPKDFAPGKIVKAEKPGKGKSSK